MFSLISAVLHTNCMEFGGFFSPRVPSTAPIFAYAKICNPSFAPPTCRHWKPSFQRVWPPYLAPDRSSFCRPAWEKSRLHVKRKAKSKTLRAHSPTPCKDITVIYCCPVNMAATVDGPPCLRLTAMAAGQESETWHPMKIWVPH